MFSLSSVYLSAKCHKPAYNPNNEILVTDKTVLITGANSGIGAVATLEMAKRGALVIMACRDLAKARTVKEDVEKKVPDAKLDLIELDLGDFQSVRKCASVIRSKYKSINILLDNAGVFFSDGTIHHTKDGLEIHMATNHMGHFLFTILLLDLLHAGAPSRIVVTSSSLALLAQFDIDDLMLEKRGGAFGFQNWGPYNNSKLANLYFVKELSKRVHSEESGIRVYALCPGLVKTDIFRNESCFTKCMTHIRLALAGLTPEQAVETVLYCSLSKSTANESGKMYHFNAEWKSFMATNLNDGISEKLWNMSKEIVDLKEDELPKSIPSSF